ncbi:MAG: hypothetical protein IT292_06680 [Deltaproteobacteria bacterium]|nr:hypothetical protein [Deltaproteobacteria bacterium]
MKLLLDTHVHFYPCYDFARLLSSAFYNFQQLATKQGLKDDEYLSGFILTETSDCHYFKSLCAGENLFGKEITISIANSAHALIKTSANKQLVIFPGRQIATKEKLEVLALMQDCAIPDGLSLTEAIAQISTQGAIPALNWGLGKWTGARAQLLNKLFADGACKDTIFADTTMRPFFWHDKLLLAAAQNKQSIIAGSDLFRISGEESFVGSYGICSTNKINLDSLAEETKQILTTPESFKIVGARSSLTAIISREAKLLYSKKIK